MLSLFRLSSFGSRPTDTHFSIMWKLMISLWFVTCSAEIHSHYHNNTLASSQTSNLPGGEISESIRVLLGKETNLVEFYRKYVKKPATTIIPGRGHYASPRYPTGRKHGRSRVGSHPVSTENREIPRGHMCLPVNTTVHVPANFTRSPNILIVPACVFVERCGGCCMSDLRSCEPTEEEVVRFPLMELTPLNKTYPMLEHVRTSYFHVIRHTKCACNCRRRAEDCTSLFHIYNEESCTCECSNIEDHENCVSHNFQTRVWNPESCECECRISEKNCTSGYSYNKTTCDCQEDRTGR